MAFVSGPDIVGLTDELVARIIDELDYIREGRVQNQMAAAFTRRIPDPLNLAHSAGMYEPPGRTHVVHACIARHPAC